MQCSATQPATQQSLTLLVRLWQVTLVVKYDSTMEVRAEVLRSSLASAPCTRCFSRCLSRSLIGPCGPLQDSGVHGFSCKVFLFVFFAWQLAVPLKLGLTRRRLGRAQRAQASVFSTASPLTYANSTFIALLVLCLGA